MKSIGWIPAFLACTQALWAQDKPIRISTDRHVYRAGQAGWVRIRLTNIGTEPVRFEDAHPWTIWRRNEPVDLGAFVYAPSDLVLSPWLTPGQSMVWWWDKKDRNGNWVPAGSYTIDVGRVMRSGRRSNYGRISIALTPSGEIAGASPFPLAVDNWWEYESNPFPRWPHGVQDFTAIWSQSGSWYSLQFLGGRHYWVTMVGLAQPTLFGWRGSDSILQGSVLFQFGRPAGFTYETRASLFERVKVGAVSESVETPAGTFPGCYRLDVLHWGTGWFRPASFWFARGIGLVRWSEVVQGSDGLFYLVTHGLRIAKVKGIDGQFYTIGVL